MEALSEEFDTTEIAAAALQMLWQSQHSGPAEAAEELNADSEQPEVGMTRLFVGLGRQDGLRPGDLVGAISNEAGLPGKAIGAIDILDRTAFVEVPPPKRGKSSPPCGTRPCAARKSKSRSHRRRRSGGVSDLALNGGAKENTLGLLHKPLE